MKTTCTVCGRSINRGDAVLRSIAFTLHAWCRDCAEAQGLFVSPAKLDADVAELVKRERASI